MICLTWYGSGQYDISVPDTNGSMLLLLTVYSN